MHNPNREFAMPRGLTGSTALVTGATAGIGRSVALALAAAGAEVIVHGRNAERGEAVVQEIAASGARARFVGADLADRASLERLVQEARDVDVLVNNAAVYLFGSTEETDDAGFDAHIETNLHAPFALVRALAPRMAARGSGAIVNVSTFGGSVAGAGGGIYGASKAALELLTLVWADEFGADGVRVNAVAAGPVRTPGTDAYGPVAAALGNAFVQGRVAEPEEVAETILFLASPSASYVNGAVLPVHGGMRAIAPVLA
jgi:NAD(P)-dependent dehydrogenase (short-subunit alcohol dehydrogenase family)